MSIGDGDPFGGLGGLIHSPLYGERSVFTFDPAHSSMAEKYEQMKLLMAQQQSVLSPEQINQMTQQVFNGPPPLASQPNGPQGTSVTTLNQRAREMLLKRIGGIRAEAVIAPGDFLTCHVSHEQVFVYYCFNGHGGFTSEGMDLFPSDTIVAQFRMICA